MSGDISPPTGIGQIHITVSDIEASVAFYRDVLGLEHLFTVPGQPMAFLQAGDVRLYLGATEDERYRSRPVLYYRVADLDGAHSVAVERGATSLSGPHRVHDDGTTALHLAFLADPDGIPVGLMQERPSGSS